MDASMAIVRAEAVRGDRALLIEAELSPIGRDRVLVNRQPLRRARDLLGALQVSVFAPDDLELVKGGPAARRRYLDDTLIALAPKNAQVISQLDAVLRQRNALLRQSGGHESPDIVATLDVWDTRLVEFGTQLAEARVELVARLAPVLAKAYDQLAHAPADVEVAYVAPWRERGLLDALAAARRDELRRGVSLIGPHRDELVLSIGGLPSRTHASQGEQRSLALALRLAAHELVAGAVGAPPVLLLDDVFSELDPSRSEALLAHLPPGQSIVTTAGPPPPGARVDLIARVSGGRIVA
jgi:DNA replication and repair protein RecF